MRFVLINGNIKEKKQTIVSLILNHFGDGEKGRKKTSEIFWQQIKGQVQNIYLVDNLYAIFNDVITNEQEENIFFNLVESQPILQKVISDILAGDGSLNSFEDEVLFDKYPEFTKNKIGAKELTAQVEKNRVAAQQKIKNMLLTKPSFIKKFVYNWPKTLNNLSSSALRVFILANPVVHLAIFKKNSAKLKEVITEQDIAQLLINKTGNTQSDYLVNLFDICISNYTQTTLLCLSQLLDDNSNVFNQLQKTEFLKLIFSVSPNEALFAAFTKSPEVCAIFCEHLKPEELVKFIHLTKQPIKSLAVLTKSQQASVLFATKLLDFMNIQLPLLPDQQLSELAQFLVKQTYQQEKQKVVYKQKLIADFFKLINTVVTSQCSSLDILKAYNLLDNAFFRQLIKFDTENLQAMLNCPYLRSLMERVICEDPQLWSFFKKEFLETSVDTENKSTERLDFITAKLEIEKLNLNGKQEELSEFKFNAFHAYLITVSPELWQKLFSTVSKQEDKDWEVILEKMHPLFLFRLHHQLALTQQTFRTYFLKKAVVSHEKLFNNQTEDTSLLKLFCQLADSNQLVTLLKEKDDKFIKDIETVGYEQYTNQSLIRTAVSQSDMTLLYIPIILNDEFLWQKFQSEINVNNVYLLARFLNNQKITQIINADLYIAILQYYDKHLLRNEIKRFLLLYPQLCFQMLAAGINAAQEKQLANNSLVVELLSSKEALPLLDIDAYISLLRLEHSPHISSFVAMQLAQDSKLCLALLEDERIEDLSKFADAVMTSISKQESQAQLNILQIIKLRRLEQYLKKLSEIKFNSILNRLTPSSKQYFVNFIAVNPAVMQQLIQELTSVELAEFFKQYDDLLQKQTFLRRLSNDFIVKLLHAHSPGLTACVRAELATNSDLAVSFLTKVSAKDLNQLSHELSYFLENETIKAVILHLETEEIARLLSVKSQALQEVITIRLSLSKNNTVLHDELLKLLKTIQVEDESITNIVAIIRHLMQTNANFLSQVITKLDIVKALIRLASPQTEELLSELCKEDKIAEGLIFAAANNDPIAVRFVKKNIKNFYRISNNKKLGENLTKEELLFLCSLQDKNILYAIFENINCCALLKNSYNFTDLDVSVIMELFMLKKAYWFIEEPDFATVLKALQSHLTTRFEKFDDNKILLVNLFTNNKINQKLFAFVSPAELQKLFIADVKLFEIFFVANWIAENKPNERFKQYLMEFINLVYDQKLAERVILNKLFVEYVFKDKTAEQLASFLEKTKLTPAEYASLLQTAALFQPLFENKSSSFGLLGAHPGLAVSVLNNPDLVSAFKLLDEDILELLITGKLQYLEYIDKHAASYLLMLLNKIVESAPSAIKARLKNDKRLEVLFIAPSSQEKKEEINTTVRSPNGVNKKMMPPLDSRHKSDTQHLKGYIKTEDFYLTVDAVPFSILLNDEMYDVFSELISENVDKAYDYLLSVNYERLMTGLDKQKDEEEKQLLYSRIGMLLLSLADKLNQAHDKNLAQILPVLEKLSCYYCSDAREFLSKENLLSQALFAWLASSKNLLQIATNNSLLSLSLLALKNSLTETKANTDVGHDIKNIVTVITQYSSQALDVALHENELISTAELLSCSDSRLIMSLLRCETFCKTLDKPQLLSLFKQDPQIAKLCFIYEHLYKSFTPQEIVGTIAPFANYSSEAPQLFESLNKSELTKACYEYCRANTLTDNNSTTSITKALEQSEISKVNGHTSDTSKEIVIIPSPQHSFANGKSPAKSNFWHKIQWVPFIDNADVNELIKALHSKKPKDQVIAALTLLVKHPKLEESQIEGYLKEILKELDETNAKNIATLFTVEKICSARSKYQSQVSAHEHQNLQKLFDESETRLGFK